jgi:hypothetical protein
VYGGPDPIRSTGNSLDSSVIQDNLLPTLECLEMRRLNFVNFVATNICVAARLGRKGDEVLLWP